MSNSRPASDVYSWVKASSKPSYNWNEINNKPSTFTPSGHNHSWSEITSKPTMYVVNIRSVTIPCRGEQTNCNNIALNINSGEYFLTFINVSSIGFVGSPYIDSPANRAYTAIWDKNWGSGNYELIYAVHTPI